MKFLRQLRAFFRREQLDAEMSEELRAHLELQAAENEKRGMSRDEAHYAALRGFGGVEQIKERVRAQRTWGWLEQARQDVRFALRALRRSPAFTVVCVLTLALGIGVNTAMFTALQAIVLRELPYAEPDRIVQVFRTSPHSQRWPHSPANFLEQQAQNDVFTHMAAFVGKPFNLAAPGEPAELVAGVQVSAELFPLLGIQPAIGRAFTTEEDRAGVARVAVLDYNFWQRRFAGDPGVVGRVLRLDGEAVTIVGVMPAAFRDRPVFGNSEIWVPLALSAEQRANRGGNFLRAVARLRPGVTLAQAQSAMDVLAARQTREHPDTNSGIGLRLASLNDAMDPRGRLTLWCIMALTGFVLLIACANLANLQFARTARRARELAIRGALGASRSRLLRQLLTESLVLALLGGALGLLFAQWGTGLLDHQINRSGELALRVNWRVLAFALGASVLAGLVFGLAPAWLAARASASETMKQGARGAGSDRVRRRMQHALIVAEVALALVLLAGAGLMVRGVQRFLFQDPGWKMDDLVVGRVSLPEAKYGAPRAQRAFAGRLEEKLSALPGAEHAALAWAVPIRQFDTAENFVVAGRPAPARGHEPIRHVDGVTPEYFAAFGMSFRAGRNFTAADGGGRPPVVIINETMARTFWPDRSPLGERIDGEEIVGVVNDVRFATDPSAPVTRFQTYRPFAQAPRGSAWLVVRGPVTADMLRRAVAEIDPDLSVIEPGAARAFVSQAASRLGGAGWLLSGLGGLGLLLASLGIYGVIAGYVVQRTKEIGVRMALGAQVRDVLWLVLRQGLRLTLAGTLIGLIGAGAAARLIGSVAPGLGAGDPVAIAAVTALLVATAGFACWLPARRAAKVDPILALRAE